MLCQWALTGQIFRGRSRTAGLRIPASGGSVTTDAWKLWGNGMESSTLTGLPPLALSILPGDVASDPLVHLYQIT